MASAPNVLIVGGGAIGVACAHELARRGARPMLVEGGPTVGGGCSYGSAGLISSGHATPIANPAALREGLLRLFDDSSTFGWRLRPSLLPWRIRFALASSSARVRSASHKPRARRRGAEGVRIELGPAAAGAVHVGQDAHVNSYGFVTALAPAAAAAGATIRTGVVVRDLRRSGRRITTVETSEGALHPGEVVLSAGVWSGRPARSIGVLVPVEGGKGYHVDLAATTVDRRVPVYLQESKIVVTAVGTTPSRRAIEIAGVDSTINPRRLATLRTAGERNLRRLEQRAVVETWTGLRPCTLTVSQYS